MKMVLMIVDADHAGDIKEMMRDCDVPGYSELPEVLGKGSTGKKLGIGSALGRVRREP